MKIEFDIEKKDLTILVKALEFAASKVNNESSFNTLQMVIQEIKEDVNNGVMVFNKLKDDLKTYTDGSPILKLSDFRTQLGISKVFINSNNGLIALLNYILKSLVNFHKPYANPNKIKKSEIGDSKTIEDLTNLIINNYESSK